MGRPIKQRPRHDVIVEEHPFNTDFNQRMIVTDTHKLVFFANRPYGELYDLTTDPNLVRNLWDDPASANLKQILLAESCLTR